MTNLKDTRKTLKLLRRITKHGVFLLSALCTIYCGLMYFNVDLFGIHLLLFGFALVLRLTLSKVFNSCWIHKMCVVYIFFVSLCVATLRHNIVELVGFDIKTLQGIMFVVGIILSFLILWKAKDKSCN